MKAPKILGLRSRIWGKILVFLAIFVIAAFVSDPAITFALGMVAGIVSKAALEDWRKWRRA